MFTQTATRTPSIIETAGAALFVREAARSVGDITLAKRAGDAALHMRGVQGLSNGRREDKVRILDGREQAAAVHMLDAMIDQGGQIAEAAEAVKVELTDPEQFQREIAEAKALAKMAGMPDIPDSPAGLVEGLYSTGPISRADLPPVRLHD